MASLTPPPSGVLEVSVFGRGFGEAIAIHIGDGRWVLIDSLNEDSEQPVTLRYLRELAVSTDAVELIIASHWHDDHAKGLAEIYKACSRALMVHATAMTKNEMNAYRGEAAHHDNGGFSSGLRELNAIANIQQSEGRREFIPAILNKHLLRVEGISLSHGHAIDIEALSPSNADVTAFLHQISERLAKPNEDRWSMPFDENDISVALWMSVGPHRLLLGADLTAHSHPDRGWNAVLNSPAPLKGRANIFKLPHHGASNGHHNGVWSSLLDPQPYAVMTTWNRSRKLPRPDDVYRILEFTPNAFITSALRRRPRPRPKMVENKVRERGARIHGNPTRAGQIRLRLDLSHVQAEWKVDLFDGAIPLKHLLLEE